MNDKNLISFFLLTLFYELWITQTILSIEGWLHLNFIKLTEEKFVRLFL